MTTRELITNFVDDGDKTELIKGLNSMLADKVDIDNVMDRLKDLSSEETIDDIIAQLEDPKEEDPKEGEEDPKEEDPKEGEEDPKEGEEDPKEGEEDPKEGEEDPKEED